MPSTQDYEQLIRQAKRRPIGARHTPIMESMGERCPKCGEEPCECPEEQDNGLSGRIPRESLETVEILAATDPRSFTFLAESDGLQVSAYREHDPLNTEATAEDVEAIADLISEDPTELNDPLDNYQSEVRKIGQEYGFIIRV